MYQLYDRGHIKSLDDPLTDYCPKFSMKNPYDLENVVTLRYQYTCTHTCIYTYTHNYIHSYHTVKANKIQRKFFGIFYLNMLIKF